MNGSNTSKSGRQENISQSAPPTVHAQKHKHEKTNKAANQTTTMESSNLLDSMPPPRCSLQEDSFMGAVTEDSTRLKPLRLCAWRVVNASRRTRLRLTRSFILVQTLTYFSTSWIRTFSLIRVPCEFKRRLRGFAQNEWHSVLPCHWTWRRHFKRGWREPRFSKCQI